VQYRTDQEARLGRAHEEVLDPEMQICDSHHHLWDGPGGRGPYLVEDFLADVSDGHHVEKTLFVECGTKYREDGPEEMRPVGETEFIRGITETPNDCDGRKVQVAAGIIALADLTLGDGVATVLEAHIKAGGGRLRGVRQSCTWDPDSSIISFAKGPDMMEDGRFREGFACLSRYGLIFDAWQYYTQLLDLADLAGAFPETTIVVNHTGGPLGIGRHAGKGQKVFDEWKRGIGELAACPNVMMKLGGFGMPRCGFGWHERREPPKSTELAEIMAPYFRFCIDTFGAGRCMFESNFPVDQVSYPYSILWNAFKRVCGDYTEKEKAALFYGTAVNVYHLDEACRT
jgi:L-fuconolactonase